MHGALAFGAQPPAPVRAPLAWGGEPPPAEAALVRARDAQLRALPPSLGVVAVAGERARVVTSAGGVQTLYEARGEGLVAWSSHAVAAAWLATGRAEIDRDGAAELLATQHVGGERSIVAGVRALAPATIVDIDAGQLAERSFWPLAERWAALPRGEAAASLDGLLLAELDRLLQRAPRPVLGLTAGLDSSVLAAALRELGVEFEAFTFGLDRASGDVVGARETATALGVSHRFGQLAVPSDDELASAHDAEVRWTEAGAPIGFGGVPWPELSHWVTGLGAETGRAFHYRWAAPRREAASPATLARALEAAGFGFRLVGAEPDVTRRLRGRWRVSIEAAYAAGHDGWSALDVVYAEQRVRRWGRGQTDRLPGHPVPGFGSQEVLRALASLPLADRLSDGFARRFLAARLPARVAGAAPAPHARLALARRRAGLARRRARAALALGAPRSAERVAWQAAEPWRERPRLVAWLRDEALGGPLVADALGARWAELTRSAFDRGELMALDQARWAGALVALERALGELNAAGAGRGPAPERASR